MMDLAVKLLAWVFIFVNAICGARAWHKGKPGLAGAYAASLFFSMHLYILTA